MPANSVKAARERIQSIDILRGIVMVLMALDHTRDYFHLYHKTGNDALDLGATNELIFLTRWITHFCAPVFVFLAGTSIFLYNSHGKTKNEVALFLITRGLWLIVCEFTIVGFAWTFSLYIPRILLGVIWVLGLSMVAMSALIYLPKKVLFVLGLLIVAGHNLLDEVNDKSLLWSVLLEPREFFSGARRIVALYSFLPWLGLMITGYFFGNLYTQDFNERKRKKILIILGSAAIILFIVLRASNAYGNANHWNTQKDFIFTILSFINTTKYPPSLLYMLMTIGPAILLLAFTENISNAFSRIMVVYGSVPFFYYILHLYLIQIAIWSFYLMSGNSINELDFFKRGFNSPWGLGYSLGIVYVVWICIVALLYYPCKWYNEYKSTHKSWWLSYI